MTDETLAEILSGQHIPTSRADLHAMLNDLLDAADVDNGNLDAPAFWGFVSGLAKGRGIADEIQTAATSMLRENPISDDDAQKWASFQWAVLFHLLKRVTAFRGELAPEDFFSFVFTAPAVNAITGIKRHPDLLGLGTNTRTPLTLAQQAKAYLVQAVLFQAAKHGLSEREAMAQILPPEGRPTDFEVSLNGAFWRTWAGRGGWKSQAAKLAGVTVAKLEEQARELAQGNTLPWVATLTKEDWANFWRLAYLSNPPKPPVDE